MAKDLTVSRIDRQNILNNDLAIQEIQSKSGIDGILWEGKNRQMGRTRNIGYELR